MRHFAVFAKYWTPGQVKTRLGADIGLASAASLAHHFARCIARRFHDEADLRQFVVAPTESLGDFTAWLSHPDVAPPTHQTGLPSPWRLEPQSTGDLGERLTHLTRSSFLRAATRLLILGTDSPNLPRPYIAQAWQALEHADVVLGPCTDGGYYLVGLSGPHTGVFQSIPWSTPQTLSATLKQVNDLRLSHQLLEPWYDVDDVPSLQRLWTDLHSQLPSSDLTTRDRSEFQSLVDELPRLTSRIKAMP